MMKRLIALLSGVLLLWSAHADERILDTHDGRELSPAELAESLRTQDFILLGELHDNPRHHQARADLLQLLAPVRPVVVAEHLEAGKTFVASGDLEADLAKAGFDARGWEWPLHRPLFQAIVDLGLPLLGGNLPPEQARKAVREGAGTLPASWRARIAEHPLSPEAEQALDHDLEQGHCGHMPPKWLPGMRLAQRARDAAMLDTLEKAPGRPAVLIAGNGHVRKDYGIPSMMGTKKYVSIGFVEAPESDASHYRIYDYIWITDPAQREDRCAQMGQDFQGSANR
jgi:uncharacterized iron-regulated protein